MAKQLKFRRGTEAQSNSFIGAEAEITVDTTNKTIRVHDGGTPGGVALAKLSDISDVGKSGSYNDLTDKPTDFLNVKDFGAKGDGVTDDSTAILSMINAVGYARFARGDFLCSTTTFDAPLFFDAGSALKVNAGNTVKITNQINAGKQFIFKGDGNYSLEEDGNSGEQARQIHVSWFGVFPSLERVGQSDKIQKAINSLGNRREGVVEFDVGNYRTDKTILVNRGIWIKGAGTRRTVFNQLSDGYPVFVTNEVACRFSGIQFENFGQGGSVRSSEYIKILHNQCEIYDVCVGRSERSIVINADACRVDNVVYIFDAIGVPNGSSVVLVNGNSNRITNIFGFSSSIKGPSSIVELCNQIDSARACTGNIIENVHGVTPSIQVLINSTLTAGIRRTLIAGIEYAGADTATTYPEAMVKIVTSGSGAVSGVSVNGVQSSQYIQSGVVVEQGSSATTEDILIDNVDIDGVSNIDSTGIKLVRTNGTFRDVTIGSNVNLAELKTPFDISGTITNLRINATAYPNAKPSISFDAGTMQNNSAVSFNLMTSIYTGGLLVTIGGTNYWFGVMRCAPSPSGVKISGTANVETATTALTGTTGTEGKFTIGFTDKVLHLENRLGSSQRVTATIMTGIA